MNESASEAKTEEEKHNRANMRWQSSAIRALQYALEMYAVELFEQAQLACIHRKRVTVESRDMHLVRTIAFRNTWKPMNDGIGDWSRSQANWRQRPPGERR